MLKYPEIKSAIFSYCKSNSYKIIMHQILVTELLNPNKSSQYAEIWEFITANCWCEVEPPETILYELAYYSNRNNGRNSFLNVQNFIFSKVT